MAEVKKDSKEAMEYVTIPEHDMFDQEFIIHHNHDHYGPGTHLVPHDVAVELNRILATKQSADIRILQPRNKEALRQVGVVTNNQVKSVS